MLKELIDSIIRVFFGHRAVDNITDWKKAHDKSAASRQEIEDIVSHHQNKE